MLPMRPNAANDPEGPWIALYCLGVLLTSLSGTACLGVIALYAAQLQAVQPVLACIGVGAVLMLMAAARLDHLTVDRTPRR